MSIDLFRLGTAIILFGVLFPLIEFIDKYVDTETAMVTLLLWIIGIVLILASAFTKNRGRRELLELS